MDPAAPRLPFDDELHAPLAERLRPKTLDEVIVHGWDIAVGSRQRFSCEPPLVEAAYGFVQSVVARNPQGTPGLFGPPVPVPDDAPLLDRLLGLTGRDPAWGAGGGHV